VVVIRNDICYNQFINLVCEEEQANGAMGTSWDLALKRLFELAAQDFVELVLPEARYQRDASAEFVLADIPLLRELGALRADVVSACELAGKPVMVHLEFQSGPDARMAERLLLYNVLADQRYRCPVWSCVVYLRRCAAPLTPYQRELPNKKKVHEFHFLVLKLWDMPAAELLQSGRWGTLPLLPLTREGQRRELIVEMKRRLEQAGRYDLLAIGFLIAALAGATAPASERQWLKEQFTMLADFIQELKQTDIYQMILEEGLKEGREKGLKEGLKEGRREGRQQERAERLNELRRMLVVMVSARFPELGELAREVAAGINEPAVLTELVVSVGLIQEGEQLRQRLVEQTNERRRPSNGEIGHQEQ
jgi:predicted transposase YdaD